MSSTAALYALTVLIWGTTWMALKLQLGVVPIAWSIAWRFALAALVLLGWLAWAERRAAPKPAQIPSGDRPMYTSAEGSSAGRRDARLPPRAAWPLLLAQGLCLFCLNFLCFLEASRWIASGLVAVCFSTAPLWNALNARAFHGQPLHPRVLLGAALGLAGLLLLFGTEVLKDLGQPHTLRGLALALAMAGTYCFSLGNLLSGALQRRGLRPLQTNAWAMLAGTVLVSAWALASGQAPAFDLSPTYVAAWLYLAIPGSVIGFTAYLTLVGRLGADRAAYCTVLFPVVALNVSAWTEGYRWSTPALLGLGLVLAGNVAVFWRGGVPSWPRLRWRP